jgi:hypothetical protein
MGALGTHTSRKDDAMSEIRSTERAHLRFAPAVDERLRKNARSLGMTLSDYLSALILGQTPPARPAAEVVDVSHAGIKVLRAINMLQADGDRSETIEVLREAHNHILNELLKAVPAYDQACRDQCESDNWGDLEALP